MEMVIRVKSKEYEKVLKELNKTKDELSILEHEVAVNSEMLIFVTWDIVDFTSTIPYETRISGMHSDTSQRIRVLPTEIVNNEDEAYTFYKKCRAAGEEGAMIKNMDMLWVPKRSKDIGKIKAVETADLRIKGWYYGEVGKQFENGLGGFMCETEDGLLRVNVGSGFSRDFRLQDASVFDKMVGGILESLYNEKIQDKKTGMWSLFLPRVDSSSIWYRLDKNTANTLGELK